MTLELTKELINRPSVTPDDAGCQNFIADRLEKSGFTARKMRFADVDNVWITHGSGAPVFTFLGHTDVVPPGALNEWESEPFSAEVRGDYLFGRGAADMKGSVAAMVIALEKFVSQYPEHPGTIALLLTSDEEGDATDGTVRVMETLESESIKIDWCLVGEPSSQDRLGDVVKNGRRGSLGARLLVKGIQGHVAYPQLAKNPIHTLAPALTELCQMEWDKGNEFYPPTSFQVSNIHAGDGTVNVIPGSVEVLLNFRFSTELTDVKIRKQSESILKKHALDYEIEWHTSGQPFITETGKLLDSVQVAIEEICGYPTMLSTSGGTSDGRFVAPTGAEVVELGPVNATIHKVNECVRVSDLELLEKTYCKILEKIFSD